MILSLVYFYFLLKNTISFTCLFIYCVFIKILMFIGKYLFYFISDIAGNSIFTFCKRHPFLVLVR